MAGAISGGLSLIGGIMGMGSRPAGPGIAPLMYIMSGREQQAAAQAEAASLSKQSSIAYEESLMEAARKEYQVRQFREQQALKFASSGITLQGSPLGVLAETEALGAQEVSAIKRRGEALSGLYEAEGLQMLRRGSAAAFSGFAQAMQSEYDAKVQAYQHSTQKAQTLMSGIGAGVQGFASLFKSSGSSSGFFQP
ncbi:MAG: hypothetical protein K2Y32_00310 [Candidatus Obscuribacterales bacterium]|nr:hypothetical protein [Candidatus Obscuribacterales bacterium]